MASLNNCNFIGNVGKIETRYMTNGEAVTNLSLAVNEFYKDKSGEKVEKTEWVNCVAYRKLAEVLANYVKVGSAIYVSGKMQTRKWQNKEGKDCYTTEIIVNEMQMLGGKSEHKTEQKVETYEGGLRKEPAKTGAGVLDMESDIPFIDPYSCSGLWRSC